jgi:hypothetical protein
LVVETKNAPIIPFDIFTNVKYRHAKLANDEAALHASNVGLGKNIKKLVFCKLKKRERCWVRPFVKQYHLWASTFHSITFVCSIFLFGAINN